MCNPPKSSFSLAYIALPQTTQKTLTKDMFHRIDLITEILSYLQILRVRKPITQFFYYLRKSSRKPIKNDVSYIFWTFKIKSQIIHAATYIALFLPDPSNCLLICLIPYICISKYCESQSKSFSSLLINLLSF